MTPNTGALPGVVRIGPAPQAEPPQAEAKAEETAAPARTFIPGHGCTSADPVECALFRDYIAQGLDCPSVSDFTPCECRTCHGPEAIAGSAQEARPETLLDLARTFDGTPTADIEARIAIAERMRPLLGERYEEFDREYSSLVGCAGAPQNLCMAVLRHMHLLMPEEIAELDEDGDVCVVDAWIEGMLRSSMPKAVPASVVADWLSRAREALDNGEPTDWHSALSSLADSMQSEGRAGVRVWLTLDLINDHTGQREAHRIGMVTAPGATPRIVACYQPGQAGPACLNEVERPYALSEDHMPHLTRTSVLTLDSEQIARLHEAGQFRYGEAQWVRLIQEDAAPAPGRSLTEQQIEELREMR